MPFRKEKKNDRRTNRSNALRTQIIEDELEPSAGLGF